ncbi:unnamed protein product [Bemisia tabaci]|uniref:C2 domain-containing protein n=2 Tax=Bemisia tabaci TaxID=7038 RepID=A0A9P0AKY5_BEMTA|nr:unnamed protein product [Bemisia tabaci]
MLDFAAPFVIMWRCFEYCCPCFASKPYDEQNVKSGLLPNITAASHDSDLYTVHKISSFGRDTSQDAHSATSSVCDETELQSAQIASLGISKLKSGGGEGDTDGDTPPAKQKGKWGKAVTKLHGRVNRKPNKNQPASLANISMMMVPPMIASTPDLAITCEKDDLNSPNGQPNPQNCVDDLGLLLSPVTTAWFRSQSFQSVCNPSEENAESDDNVDKEKSQIAKQYGLDASLYNCSQLSKSSEAINRAWKSMGDIPTHERFIELAYGTVCFTAQFRDKKFVIHIIKLVGLAPKGKALLEYPTVIKLTILPLEKQAKQSKTLPSSSNPEVNQDFSFHARDISNKILRISVFDVERQGKYSAVGHALFYLEDVKSVKKIQSYEMKLFRQSLPNVIPGCLFVSLEYSSSSKSLNVFVEQASKLEATLAAGKCRLYVKLLFLQGNKRMKELESPPVLMQNLEAKLNYTDSIKIDENHIKDSSLVIALKYKGMFHDKNVGRVIFGPYFYSEFGHKLTPWGRLFLKNEQIKYSFRMYL